MPSQYKIQPHSYEQAKKLNVKIKPSSNPKKKIDVFKNNERVASIGDIKYNDYTTYLLKDKTLAEERRKLYKKRHQKYSEIVGSNSYYADKILW